jgi:nitrogen fixation protein
MASVTYTVGASADDASINVSGSYEDTATTQNLPGAGTTTTNYGHGWRFTNVTLTDGDTPQAAHLSLMKSGGHWNGVDWRLAAIAEDNTATFSSGSPPGSRAITTVVAENQNQNKADGTRYDYPSTAALQADFADSIWEVFARGGWASGNALGIVCNSDQDASASTANNGNTYHTWDSSTSSSEPQLVIDYYAAGEPIPPEFIAIGTASAVASGNLTNVALPTHAEGDLLLCHVTSGHDEDNSMSGWTREFGLDNGTAMQSEVFWKIAGASESNPTVTNGGDNFLLAHIASFRHIDATTPIEDIDGTNGSATTTVTHTLVTAAGDARTLVALPNFADDDNTAFSTITNYTSPAGNYGETSLGNDGSLGLQYRRDVAAGDYGPVTCTATGGANDLTTGIHLVLKPADVSGAQTVNANHLQLTTLHQPTVTPGAVTVSANHLQLTTLHNPAVAYQIAAQLLGPLAALHNPSVTPGPVTVAANHLQLTSLHQPSVTPGGVSISAEHLALTTLHQPTITTQTDIAANHLQLTTLHQPTVTPGAVTVAANHLALTTLHQPAVSQGGATQTIDANHLQLTTLHQPTVTPGAVSIAANHLQLTTIHEPLVTTGAVVQANHLQLTSLHQPSVTTGPVTINANHLGPLLTLHEPSVSQTGAPQTVTAEHLALTTLYQPGVSYQIAAQLIGPLVTLPNPAVTVGAVTIQANHLQLMTIHQPAVIAGIAGFSIEGRAGHVTGIESTIGGSGHIAGTTGGSGRIEPGD